MCWSILCMRKRGRSRWRSRSRSALMTGCSGGDEPRLTSGPRTFIKLAALAAIEEVDEEADDEPDEEAHPGARGQAGHQQYAEDDAEYREERAAGNAEAAVALGLVAAQDKDCLLYT